MYFDLKYSKTEKYIAYIIRIIVFHKVLIQSVTQSVINFVHSLN